MMVVFKLKSLLAEKGYTQTELSRLTGIRQPTISSICNNSIKELSVVNMEKICDELDCEPGDFIKNIPAEDFENRRSMMSKKYYVPTTTRQQRENMVNSAIALSTLDAPEPSTFTSQLAEEFVEGNISEEEMLKAAIKKYQM